jgi:hypothetical protein
MVAVAESERGDYAEVVPPSQLLLHDDLPTLPDIRNWLSRTIQEDCLVQVDDDLKWVSPMIGKRQKCTDPLKIWEIIDNTHTVAADLDITVFCYSRSQNSFLTDPEFLPFRLAAPLSSTFGLRGAARERLWDNTMMGRADMDFLLRTLLEDRIVLCDMRLLFDHGRVFSGRGGAVGMISAEHFADVTVRLSKRWGRFIGHGPNFRKTSNTSPMSIKVNRMNPLARRID